MKSRAFLCKEQKFIPKKAFFKYISSVILLYFILTMYEDMELLGYDFVFSLDHNIASDSPLKPLATQKQPKYRQDIYI